jgi:colanic acid biosynthesis glycosyl transferase WcaI
MLTNNFQLKENIMLLSPRELSKLNPNPSKSLQTRKLRILIYSYNYYPEPIGIAPLMTELAEGLTKRGHEVRVLTAMPWYPDSHIHPHYQGKLYCTEERRGVKIYRSYVWTRPERSLINRLLFELSFAVLSFWQGVKQWSPDVILLTVPSLPVCVPAAVLSWLHRCPLVLNLQDILPDAAIQVGLLTNEKMIRIFKSLEKFAYNKAAKISVIADGFTKNLLRKGVDCDKIVKIYNWVDINFIKPLPKKNNYFIRENNLGGKFIILYAGNIALTQPLETLIDAAAILQNLPDLAVVIVGTREALSRLEKYCQQIGCKNVLLKPLQPREKLPEMLAAADIGMVMQKTNVVDFNMPSKIQILLASGRPIIGSIPLTGTAARAIQNSGGGVVVPPENPQALASQIKEWYCNRAKLKIIGQKAREYAETHYTIDIALDKYESLFASLINNNTSKI